MRSSLWITLAVLLVAIGAPNAHADTVTLDVSGTMTASAPGSCLGSTVLPLCTLGGDIVINNTTGAIISVDVTITGASPTFGPFTTAIQLFDFGLGRTLLRIRGPASQGLSVIDLVFDTPTPGSLVNYDGGALTTATSAESTQAPCSVGTNPPCIYFLSTGELTPAVAAPEPSSVALMLLGIGLVFVMRKRIGQRLPQAS
jgi:hypothetical protein